MSAGPDFDPSLLDNKDRAELVAIATQLGQKPPARAKKADIVTLIMELVGAGDAGPSATADDRRDAGDEATPDPAVGAPSSGEATGDDRSGEVQPGRARSDQGGGPDRGSATADDGRDERGSRSAGASEGGGGSDARPGGDKDGGGSNQGGRGGGRNQGGSQGGASPGGGSQGAGQSGGQGNGQRRDPSAPAGPGNEAPPSNESIDDDGANRRRRRRGRDRQGRNDGDDQQNQPEPIAVEGLVDLREEGYGFLRVNGFRPSRDDVYVSVKQTRQFGLRTGDIVRGKARPANRNERNPALLQVEGVNGHPSHQQPSRARFEDLTPLFPDERLRLESDDPANTTVRIIDLVSPIGKGQRGLIVSPPKAGKTTIVKHVVRSIEVNHPEVELIVLLVDERPEEVTDMRRWLRRGQVAASTFDRPAAEHIEVAELVIERAKRLVEQGKDVVVVLDGITRLARAYNLAAPATGRIMAGGIDTGALYPPKKFFGAARNAEEGGSLTILATALVETNTRMDEVIFEEFKGTGNMELKLDRKLAERRIFPAIDVDASSTRHEELLFDRNQLQQVWKLRRVLGALRDESGSSAASIEMLDERLKAFKTNDEFLAEVARTTTA